MVKVDKYIRQLLFEHDCVIIPDFGGLLTHHMGVHYDEAKGTFLPASKRLAFNEILRLDDGLLSYWISKQENIHRDQATEAVQQYVEDLRLQLKSDRRISIDRIGNFSANNEGKLVFEPDYSQNFDSAWYGFQSVEARLVANEDIETITTQKVRKLNSTNALVTVEASRPKSWSRLGWVAAAALAGAIFMLSMIYRPIDGNMLSTLNPLAAIENFFIRTPDDDNQPVAPYAYAEPTPTLTPTRVQNPVSVWEVAPVSKVPLVEAQLSKTEVVEVVESLVVEKKVERRYHLIAGSFTGTKNVNALMRKLSKVGFSNSSVVRQGNKKWVMVAAASYPTEREAYNHKTELDAAIGVESWVLKK